MEVSTFNGGEEGEEEPLDGLTWFSSYFMVRCFAFVHPQGLQWWLQNKCLKKAQDPVITAGIV
jgi:hypothetical protein